MGVRESQAIVRMVQRSNSYDPRVLSGERGKIAESIARGSDDDSTFRLSLFGRCLQIWRADLCTETGYDQICAVVSCGLNSSGEIVDVTFSL